MKFRTHAAEYVERASATWKASTNITYNSLLETMINPIIGERDIASITAQDVARLRNTLRETRSATRVNMAISVVRTIFADAVKIGLISKNPAEGIARLRQAKPKIKPLTLKELNAVLDKIDPHWQPFFIVLAWTGARPGEMCALKWDDIDFDREEIHIHENRVAGTEDTPKSEAGDRVIKMLPPVKAALQSLPRITRHVFLTKQCLPIDRPLDRTWHAALLKAGVDPRPMYQLRHTFASQCLTQGISLPWVSKTLGHSSIAVTLERYARYIPGNREEEKLLHLFQ